MDEKPKIIVIAGPTAGGKTSLSVELALALGGEIVSADAMQVYRYMDVGTAKPSTEERRGIAHHLLDVVNPDEAFNAAVYRDLALAAIRDIRARGKVCLVVGGTGLYIKALLKGIFECPETDEDLRRSLLQEARDGGAGKLYEFLEATDPESAARIHPNDVVRIVRAVEIYRLTGKPASQVRTAHGFQEAPVRALKLYLRMDREVLYRRIDRRSLDMVRDGLIEETRGLLERGYSPDLKPMQAIGYRHMVKCLDGVYSREEAVETLQKDTRRYAKRQLTWFRADPEAEWLDPEDRDAFTRKIGRFMSEAG
ncbi:MAG: tRNA (adenosine(37)-N6)-dimethylallyltransferase MiaA [Deltaproteobacteria bacterium]|nr:tRNA (adenosine(37)-N6)-dimethylallyltransferase MiaA [Deltaproteobacteria bacterium]MBW2283988.1 tRNA (adenosine(37)-N6)-dimethylallyltransferase MiaA [Deltaproteobacteria bacterium]